MKSQLLELFNKQINREFYTGYLYYAMSTYFDEVMMQGFSMYMKHLSSKELANYHNKNARNAIDEIEKRRALKDRKEN